MFNKLNKKSGIVTILIALMVIASIVSFSGCLGGDGGGGDIDGGEAQATIQVTDMAGRTVEVPENVDRVAAVGAGALRQLAYFNAMDKAVGTEQYEQEEEAVPYIIANKDIIANLPSVGPNHGGNAELIAGAQPEVIFFSLVSGDISDANNLQSKTGIPVVVVDMGDLYHYRHVLYDCWDTYGSVLGKEDRAQELQDYTEALITDLDSRTNDIPDEDKPLLYAGGTSHRGGHGLLGSRSPYTSFQHLNANDALDVLGHEESTPVNINREDLLNWNPDMMYVDIGNIDLIRNDFNRNPSYKELKAYQEGQIYGILPTSSYQRNFESTLANSYFIGSTAYPDEFSDIGPEEKADEIYTMFLGEPVYQELADKLGAGYGPVDL
ncbi:ABC transporter substrate-binding protein [Methanosalsum natronophilum]|nr:ABC transporter substrate-binding protein [Methanosalsum natronophilum]MCS3923846.1 iron complex transport system substrate-binding protein [Methanosalsum natronophilum]